MQKEKSQKNVASAGTTRETRSRDATRTQPESRNTNSSDKSARSAASGAPARDMRSSSARGGVVAAAVA
ncbi:MAG: hypothetical protein HC914_22025, partial [Chloroflexaceae bacterium]|nr:hypothetical protein [Chloroflexaceae bacterium]